MQKYNPTNTRVEWKIQGKKIKFGILYITFSHALTPCITSFFFCQTRIVHYFFSFFMKFSSGKNIWIFSLNGIYASNEMSKNDILKLWTCFFYDSAKLWNSQNYLFVSTLFYFHLIQVWIQECSLQYFGEYIRNTMRTINILMNIFSSRKLRVISS